MRESLAGKSETCRASAWPSHNPSSLRLDLYTRSCSETCRESVRAKPKRKPALQAPHLYELLMKA